MGKFKVGDFVTYNSSKRTHPELVDGSTYIIEQIKNGYYVYVSGHGMNPAHAWNPDWFELKGSPTAEQLKQQILSLRKERAEAIVLVSSLEKREKEVVSQLAALGFVLCGQEDTVLTDNKEDPKNWEVGDTLISLNSTYTSGRKGVKLLVTGKSKDAIFYECTESGRNGRAALTDSTCLEWLKTNYKFLPQHQ